MPPPTRSLLRELIASHTRLTSEHSLTPELRLRLLTSETALYHGRREESPFKEDPFWAIYWPGEEDTWYCLKNYANFDR